MLNRATRFIRSPRAIGPTAGLAVLASLALVGPAASPVTAAAGGGCDANAPANARVGYGHSDGADPNTVSAAKAHRMQATLKARVERARANGKLRAARAADTITVKTYVHVLRRDDGTGGATTPMVNRQIDVLNNAYAGRTSSASTKTPFKFKVVGIDFTNNTAWYDWGVKPNGNDDAESKDAKKALHQGSGEDLNLYIANISDGILGYATFPTEDINKRDGVVLLDQSLPGGNAAPYNLGDTAPHEVGHWLYLFHTFQGGCRPPGDYVDDTPAQDDGDNIFYCGDNSQFGDDTCPAPGLDPVHNFMSYGDDTCLDRFTPDQSQRMVEAWAAFRDGK